MWEAQYVIVIASRTGWTEDYIKWKLPLSRGMAYYHAARMLDGVAMRWPEEGEKVANHVDSVRDRVRQRLGKR